MQLYRLIKAKHWSGRLEPGVSDMARWHSDGRSVIYCATSPPLALLEWIKGQYAARLLDREVRNAALTLIAFDPPLEMDHVFAPGADALPDMWWALPNRRSVATQKIGNAWLDAQTHVAMRVPSATLPESLPADARANLLINPAHPDWPKLQAALTFQEHPFNLRHYLGMAPPKG